MRDHAWNGWAINVNIAETRCKKKKKIKKNNCQKTDKRKKKNDQWPTIKEKGIPDTQLKMINANGPK